MLHVIPDGFEPLSMTGGLIEMLGPFFCKHASDDSLVFGLLSEPKHGNPNGIVHGATFVALIDTCMGSVIEHSTGRKCATIDLDTQFVAEARSETRSKRAHAYAR